MEESLTFKSGDLDLSGVLHLPDDSRTPRPVVVVLHGFGSNKNAGNVVGPTGTFLEWGYAVFRFDMRGCGESGGTFGHIFCEDQVEDARAAVTFLRSRPDIDPERVALVGSSFGAAVAVYAAAVDKRVAAAVSSGGWGHGERKFRGQHPTPEAWAAFTRMLADGKRHRAETGESLMVDRHAIVPIPEHLRGNLAPGSVSRFPAETAQSMFDFRAEEVVADIAPRPLLLLHSSNDSVTPTEQSVEMFKRAGQPTDLHLTADTDHFMFAETNVRVMHILRDWLDRYFPAAP